MQYPEWLKVRVSGDKLESMLDFLKGMELDTVCHNANCPNMGECFDAGTVTFMIMGNICTRNCRFCAVPKGKPQPLDNQEPRRVAAAARELKFKHAVITCVTRDDLPDGGAGHFAATITALKQIEGITVEVLVSDFKGSRESVQVVLQAGPDVFNHNIETVPSLYSRVRPGADYNRSLQVLEQAKAYHDSLLIKSGIMVGLGETREEVAEVMKDLLSAGCDILTIGQYLQPSANHLPVAEFITPGQFQEYRDLGKELGLKFVASGPLVRSSYHAAEAIETIRSDR